MTGIRLFTQGTDSMSVHHTGVFCDPYVPGINIMRNGSGYFAVGDGTWLGYFPTQRVAELAVAMVRAITQAGATDLSEIESVVAKYDHAIRADAAARLARTVRAFDLPLHTDPSGEEAVKSQEYNKQLVKHCIAQENKRKIPRKGILRMCRTWLEEGQEA